MTIQRVISSLTALAVSMVMLATANAAPSQADQRFEAMLKAIDTMPTRAQLLGGWPDARERLVAAAGSSERDEWTRSRAITFLSFFTDEATRAALVALSDDPLPFVRESSVYTLARAFGRPGDAGLVAMILTRVDDPDQRVSDKAVRGLRWIDHPAAERALVRLTEAHVDQRVRRLAEQTRTRRVRRLSHR